MASEIAKAYVQIVPSAQGISGSISSLLSPEASSAGTSAGSSIGNNMLSSMKKLLIGGGLAAIATEIVKGLSSCVSEAMSFDAEMSQVAATMGTTTDQIEELTEFAKEMGSTTAFSAEEAAQGLNTLAMAGLNAEEQMEALPTVLNLASAGALSLDSAASYVTGTIKGFGASMEDAEYYADLMAKGATLANTNVSDLGEALSSSAATASSYGQEADSVTLSLLRLAEQNVTGSEAATALNRAMADLYTPTDAAKGVLEELGVACYDETGAARDVNDVMDELAGVLSEYDAETANAYKDTIFTTQGLSAFNKMTASSTETVDGFKEALADCTGSAMQQAETQLDNLQGDVTLFQSAMSGLKIAVGEALTPALRSITQFGTNAVSTFTDIITGEKSVGDIFDSVCQSIADRVGFTDWYSFGDTIRDGILSGVSKLIQEIPSKMSEFVTSINQKIVDTDWREVGHELSSKIINGVVSIISEIPTRINAFTTSIVTFFKETDWSQVGYDVVTTILTAIKTKVVDVPAAIGKFVSGIWDTITETDWLGLGKDILMGIINGITNVIPAALESIGNVCSGMFNAFKDFFGISSPSTLMAQQGGYIVEGLEEGISDMPERVNGILESTADFATAFGESVSAFMDETGKTIDSLMNGNFSDVREDITSRLSETYSRISSWGSDSVAKALDTAKTMVTNVKNGLSTLVNTVNSPLTNAFTTISNWGRNATNTAMSTARNFVTNTRSGMSSIGSTVNTLLQNASNYTQNWRTTMQNLATNAGNSFRVSMTNALSPIVSNVSNVLSNMQSNVSGWNSNFSNTFYGMGQNMMNGLMGGVSSRVDSMYNSIKSQLSGLVDRAKSSLGIHSPSTVFRDEVGAMIGEGIAVGIDDSTADVESSMDDLISATEVDIPQSGFSYGVSGESGTSLSQLYALLEEYLPMLANMDILLDGDAVVGELTPKIDKQLGKMSLQKARGVA